MKDIPAKGRGSRLRDGNRSPGGMDIRGPCRLKAGVPVCGMETLVGNLIHSIRTGLKAGVPVCGMETKKANRLRLTHGQG